MNVNDSQETKLAVLETKFAVVGEKLDQHILDSIKTSEKIISQLADISNKVTILVSDTNHDHSAIVDLRKDVNSTMAKIDLIEMDLVSAKATITTLKFVAGFLGVTTITGLATFIQWLSTLNK